MLKNTKPSIKIVFFGLSVDERILPRKIGKRIYRVRPRYFHFAFKRIFSDLSFSRSLRHKTSTFDAYVEKRKRTRWHTSKTRVRNAVRTWLECRWTRNREFIKNEQRVIRLSLELFPRKRIFRLSDSIVFFYQSSEKRWMAINKLKSKSRNRNIHH